MKKLIVFIFLGLCLFATGFSKLKRNPLFEAYGVEKVCFVANNHCEVEGVECVECGDMTFNFCTLEVVRKNLDKLQKDLIGLQFYFEDADSDGILRSLNADVVSTENIDGLVVLNCYTPYFDKSVFVKCKKVNLQIAIQEGKVVAGFPVLLTGF